MILVGPKDERHIVEQLTYTRRNIIGYRNIYIVTTDTLFTELQTLLQGCIVINETIFPFEIQGTDSRNGWYLQQLIKLYAGSVITGIMSTYLVIDCDTFFLRPTMFIKNNKCLYAYGTEYHLPYFGHISRLLPGLSKVDGMKSGICHHMIFEQECINTLFTKVEDVHQKPFWCAFLECVDTAHFQHSGASEYELYFNYILTHHTERVNIRELPWTNSKVILSPKHYAFVSCHWYIYNNEYTVPIVTISIVTISIIIVLLLSIYLYKNHKKPRIKRPRMIDQELPIER